VTRGEDPQDRRLVLLQITDKGRKIITDIHVSGLSRIKETLNRMSQDDVAALNRGVSALLAAVEEDSKELPADKHPPE
jgi:DNA-binding MarR family transcriptional regulator